MSKTYIIGDIHGCYDEFIELINQIGITDDDLVISLGDIVDRGNKSLELYQYFKNRKNAIVLMGNHERKHLNGVLSYSQEIVKVQFGDEYEAFREWLTTLPYYYETPEAMIVHAFFEHDKRLHEQKEEVLAGTTSGSRYLENKYEEGTYWSDYYSGKKPIIYGHHVVGDAPKIKNNTYGIDTGACHGGKLTVIELPSFQIHQVQVQTDHWKEQQSSWQIPVLEAKDWEQMKIDQVYRQLDKLSYKKEPEIQAFLAKQRTWIQHIERVRKQILTQLENRTKELMIQHGDRFNQEVAKLSYKSFVFKAKAGTLALKDLEKTLHTPQKILDLAYDLQLENIPSRTT
ncbi:bis(5'-nucleosyl)-tetraphosphatase PrpE (asymmetrical) [Kordia sp. SMS9]|uniref:metallophosphoesterase n=1 Tax=Kordia sp. SMS9 TaxID=2282170 RepID=UPI000E0CC53D|nr:metallophosphoesterase [Kordia sp. SMS9]AXG69435.1 bis(5'-nucleosyl)-tetraphosphatase PrpE (asymmetrical) [Kordia sp. SMS9]